MVLMAGTFRLSLDAKGELHELVDTNTGIDYRAQGIAAPLLSIHHQNELRQPESATFDADNAILVLRYASDVEARVKVASQNTHLTFELVALSTIEDIELVVWGPYPTKLDAVIGETVGVVQGEEYALGLQALNPKTLGGYPWNPNDAMPQLDIFESGDFSDMSEEGKRHVLYRVEAAKPDSFSVFEQVVFINGNDGVLTQLGHPLVQCLGAFLFL